MNVWKTLLPAAVLGTLSAWGGVALAAPSVLGPSGYIFTPDDTTLPKGCITFGYHQFDLSNPGGWDTNSYVLGAGLSDRTELTITDFDHVLGTPRPNLHRFGTNNLVTGNLKLSAIPETERRHFNIIAGVTDFADTIKVTPYIYGSFSLGSLLQHTPWVGFLLPRSPVRAGVGYATGMIKGPFVNAALALIPNVEFHWEFLKNEFRGYRDTGYQNNVGVRFRTGRKFPGIALDFDTVDLHRLSFGISYTHCPPQHEGGGEEEEKGKGDQKPRGGEELPPAPAKP